MDVSEKEKIKASAARGIVRGATVFLAILDDRTISRLKVGSRGKIRAVRPDIDSQVLVKWEGKSGYVSHDADHLIVAE